MKGKLKKGIPIKKRLSFAILKNEFKLILQEKWLF